MERGKFITAVDLVHRMEANCTICGELKARKFYGTNQWKRRKWGNMKCKACVERTHGRTTAARAASQGGIGSKRSVDNVCYDFQEGNCQRGDSCKFDHTGVPREMEEQDEHSEDDEGGLFGELEELYGCGGGGEGGEGGGWQGGEGGEGESGAGSSSSASSSSSSYAARTGRPTTLKLFHGTSWANAQNIQRDGFVASAHGCLGPGVYVGRADKARRFAMGLIAGAIPVTGTPRHGGTAGGLVTVLIDFKNPKYIEGNDSEGSWHGEGHDACRSDFTSASQNMEWCVHSPEQVRVVSIQKIALPSASSSSSSSSSPATTTQPKSALPARGISKKAPAGRPTLHVPPGVQEQCW